MDKTVNNTDITDIKNNDVFSPSETENGKNTSDTEIKASKSDSLSLNCSLENSGENMPKNKDKDFDIVDFIISHSDDRSVRKKSKLPKILLCVILALLIVGMCVLFAVWSASAGRNKLYGTWKSTDGIVMTVTDKDITINGSVSEYISEEKNVISIKMNNEYYKLLYKLDGDTLTLTVPDESGITELKYTRIS